MTNEHLLKYLDDCLNPGDPVGFQMCMVRQDAPFFHFTPDDITTLDKLIEKRSKEVPRFPWELVKKVRYV